MARAIAISVVVACLLMGCVSLGPSPTTQPSLGPSFVITTLAPIPSASATSAPTASPSATASPIEAATATPTEAPTVGAPTVGPSNTPAPPLTPAPSMTVIEDFGADELLFADDFSDATSGFGVATNAGGTVAYVNGALQFDTASQGSWMWSRRSHPLAWPVLHVEADMTPSANGYAGLLCANNDDELWGAVANAAGLWFFISLDSNGSTILSSNQEPGWEIPPATTTRMALDCAGAETGSFRMQLSLPDIGLAATYEAADGPDGFDRAGVYAESSAHPYSLRVDNVFAYGGEGQTATSPEAQALLLHVPADWRANCFETAVNPFETGALTSVSCPLTDVGGNSNVADYVQFDTTTNMDTAYQQRVTNYAAAPTGSCELGPNEAEYHFTTDPSTTIGWLLCAPQIAGIRFDWTHDALMILSTLTDFDSSYGDAWADWLIAGPD